MKKCMVCGYEGEGLTVGKTINYKNKIGKIKKYIYYICRKCNAIKQRKYYSSKKGKESITKRIINYEKTHPERRAAWRAVSKVPLKLCEICGEIKTHRHHPDPLEKESIVFLCPTHHKQAHIV